MRYHTTDLKVPKRHPVQREMLAPLAPKRLDRRLGEQEALDPESCRMFEQGPQDGEAFGGEGLQGGRKSGGGPGGLWVELGVV